MIKINIGSHNKKIEGFLNMDIMPLENVDIIQDITKPPYNIFASHLGLTEAKDIIIPNDSVEEIVCHEVLEHISFRELPKVLAEFYRILAPGGSINIQVPDIGAMCEFYYKNQIDKIIPHKPQSVEEVLDLQEETGKMVNPVRWKMAFAGAQKHKYDFHLNHFTNKNLSRALLDVGFLDIEFIPDPVRWKLKVIVKK